MQKIKIDLESIGVGGWNNKRKIRIRNFRSIVMDDFIEIRPITLLFGKNGAGKSSFIKAIKFLGNNLFPLTTEQTVYNIDNNINLGSFKEIVFQQDLAKNIQIEFEEYSESYKEHKGIRDSNIISYGVNAIIKDNKEGKNFASLKIKDQSDLSVEIFPNEQNNFDKEIAGDIAEKDQPVSLFGNEGELKKYLDNSLRSGSLYPNDSIDVKRKFNGADTVIKKFISNIDILPFIDGINDLEFSYYRRLMNHLNLNKDQQEFVDNFINHFFYRIPTTAKKFFNCWYVTPIRERPLCEYKLIGNKFGKNDYYGILSLIEGRNPKKYLPYPPTMDILNFVNDSLASIGLGKELIIKKSNGFGSVYIKDMFGVEHNLAESSSGLIQIIPIIVFSFNALYEYESYITRKDSDDSTDVIIIEQPELHLHPSLQVKLIDFIKSAMSTYIIETHSEHIVRKLQVLIAKGELSKDKVAIYYFDKDDKTGITSISEMEFEDNGFFKKPWPDGFFDDSYNLATELIYARKN